MSGDLTPSEYAILLLLRDEDREISNTELDHRYGFRLTGALYARLNGTGYVITNTQQRPYRHRLSAAGTKVLREPLVTDEEGDITEKRTFREKVLWAALLSLHAKSSVPAPDNRSLDERVRAAYAEVAGGEGDWVSLTVIRPLLADVAKAELDRALEKMLDAPDVRLDTEANRHRVGDEEKAAAVRIGGEDRHKLAIGLR
ncbi:hypothetical protein JIG36_35505 [Actinoplanes sp. LDG1-06]|uniref:Uncharacterized protein n=1 Tax=Paractinoplanes ovalisporus TaxID=2810368 RepID=A0ABS2ALV3_9ACTN|nr:hypothetical protein [Actinoplanes ovalisporus]MBM2620820.1 hypothetical protein [Actinoplanes ovalisporus]